MNGPVLADAWDYFLSQQRIPREIVYHYTNLAAITNILSTKKMWATDLRFMNDPEELTYGAALLDEALLAAASKERHPERSKWLMLMTTQSRGLQEISNWYSISVCQTADLESQWVNYGYGGVGFVLGWSIDTLPPEVPIHLEVVYDRQRQLSLVRRIIEFHLAALRPKKTLYRGRGHEAMLDASGSLGNFLNIFLFNFKRDTWASENEIRYVYQGVHGQPPSGTVVKLKGGAPVEKPYIESDFSTVPLRLVIAGPRVDDRTAWTVRSLLDANGYHDTPIVKSACEF